MKTSVSGPVPVSTVFIQDAEFYTFLKEEIKQVFGRPIITSRDCIDLQTEIYQKISFKVSRDTLRRFFNLVANKYKPGTSTIEILCKYCGFNSPGEFSETKYQRLESKLCDPYFFFKYLVQTFPAIPEINKPDETFFYLMKATVIFLREYEELANLFQKAIVKTENGMHYYFEQFICLDKLYGYYGNGLLLYINEARTPDRKIFGYSLLCLKYWYEKNYNGITEIFMFFKNYPLSKKNAPVCGLYFVAAILDAEVTKKDAEAILVNAHNLHVYFKTIKTNIQDSFEFIYCRALLMAGHAKEALYYIEYLLSTYLQPGMPDSYELYHTLLLLKCMALTACNNLAKALDVFALIQPTMFNFLSTAVDTELYTALRLQFNELASQEDRKSAIRSVSL